MIEELPLYLSAAGGVCSAAIDAAWWKDRGCRLATKLGLSLQIHDSNTVEPLLKDPPRKRPCINYLSTRDILKTPK